MAVVKISGLITGVDKLAKGYRRVVLSSGGRVNEVVMFREADAPTGLGLGDVLPETVVRAQVERDSSQRLTPFIVYWAGADHAEPEQDAA